VYMSTVPTELLLSQGPPQFTPIVDTSLLYVENSGNDIFLDNSSQMFYILVSGRWLRSKFLQNGPWSYITAADLPSDFAEIPTYSPKASVLVSISGTPQAKEALIANQIPQTAAISRSAATLHVTYYGAPDFQLIEGTHLRYAVNTTTPVIYIPGSNIYYAVQDAVWFTSPNAGGPWTVATSLPPAIYTIPPSSPIHYVTYVQVYGYTPTTVYVGYTPGYYGTVVSWENVVVYGTGWSYPPYIGRADWVPRPHTYGVGSAFSWSAGAGWDMGFGLGMAIGSECSPWWAPVSRVRRTRIVRGGGAARSLGNTYNSGPVSSGGVFAPNTRNKNGGGSISNNLYADRYGNVYRANPRSGWQQYTIHGWSSIVNAAMRSSLDLWQSARALGAQRCDNFHSGGWGRQRLGRSPLERRRFQRH